MKKKVEHASNGHIIEIVYKGQHNHEKHKANRCVKDNKLDSNENASIHYAKSESNSQQGYWVGNSNKIGGESWGILMLGFLKFLCLTRLSKNQKSFCKQEVKLIFWMLGTGGTRVQEKERKRSLVWGGT
ncbi:WRKY transcription factor 4 [Spatholobus suberectus]|nr:WRKY transcription factor 4 [Spatholobus suberectus]